MPDTTHLIERLLEGPAAMLVVSLAMASLMSLLMALRAPLMLRAAPSRPQRPRAAAPAAVRLDATAQLGRLAAIVAHNSLTAASARVAHGAASRELDRAAYLLARLREDFPAMAGKADRAATPMPLAPSLARPSLQLAA